VKRGNEKEINVQHKNG